MCENRFILYRFRYLCVIIVSLYFIQRRVAVDIVSCKNLQTIFSAFLICGGYSQLTPVQLYRIS
jgi:hypothetical protein